MVARLQEPRRELEAPLQQRLGIGVAAETGAGLGQHADGGDVGRRALQPRAQDPLGHRQLVVAEGLGRLHELRIVDRGADRAGVGFVGAGRIARERQLVGERAPGRGQPGVELACAAQGGDRGGAFPGRRQRQAEREARLGPVGTARGQVGEDRLRACSIVLAQPRLALEQDRVGAAGDGLQYGFGLLFGEGGRRREQPAAVRQRRRQRPARDFSAHRRARAHDPDALCDRRSRSPRRSAPSLAPPSQPNATSTRQHGKKTVAKIAHASAAAVQPGRTPAERLSTNSGQFVTFFAVRNASVLGRNLRGAFYGVPLALV